MQLKLFVVPIKNLGAAEAEMNAFLRGHRALAVKKEFVPDGENSFWSFCVGYLDGAAPGAMPTGGRVPKVDYKQPLAHRGPDKLAVILLQGLQLVGGEINAEGQSMAVVKNLRARSIARRHGGSAGEHQDSEPAQAVSGSPPRGL